MRLCGCPIVWQNVSRFSFFFFPHLIKFIILFYISFDKTLAEWRTHTCIAVFICDRVLCCRTTKNSPLAYPLYYTYSCCRCRCRIWIIFYVLLKILKYSKRFISYTYISFFAFQCEFLLLLLFSKKNIQFLFFQRFWFNVKSNSWEVFFFEQTL